MDWTRREFLVSAGVAVATATLAPEAATREAPPAGSPPAADPAYLVGDPYLAMVDGAGLGGRSFEEAREHALRFRTPPEHRDRHVLGIEHA